MQTCSTGKRIYDSMELAEEALIGAHIAFNYGKGQGPIGVYLCEDCGRYHLTSQGTLNKRLEQMLKEGEIQKQKNANWWEGKFRGR